jgi:hypothetical protein
MRFYGNVPMGSVLVLPPLFAFESGCFLPRATTHSHDCAYSQRAVVPTVVQAMSTLASFFKAKPAAPAAVKETISPAQKEPATPSVAAEPVPSSKQFSPKKPKKEAAPEPVAEQAPVPPKPSATAAAAPPTVNSVFCRARLCYT